MTQKSIDRTDTREPLIDALSAPLPRKCARHIIPGMFRGVRSDQRTVSGDAYMCKGFYTSVSSLSTQGSWGRDQRPQVPPPNPRPLPSSLLFRTLLFQIRAFGASRKSRTNRQAARLLNPCPTCIRCTCGDYFPDRTRVGRSLLYPFLFLRYKAFPRGRSSKGRSITAMGREPAIISESPLRPIRLSYELEEVGVDPTHRPLPRALGTKRHAPG